MVVILFFFFSSRRRHTRLVSDWSSDVCSSDLPSRLCNPRAATQAGWGVDQIEKLVSPRSEERRVGKEYRSMGWRYLLVKRAVLIAFGWIYLYTPLMRLCRLLDIWLLLLVMNFF